MTPMLSKRRLTTVSFSAASLLNAYGLGLFFTLWSGAVACAPAAPVPKSSSMPAPQPAPPARADRNTMTYFEFQVEKPVTRLPNSAYPKRPSGATEPGHVLAQFVVDTTGAPVMSTFKVLRAPSDAHAVAVREAVTRSRYLPAEIGGIRVNQLVQEEFVF
jgi:hypothetical protein